MTLKQLREIPDERLIELHDQQASNTFVGISYYLDELQRRDAGAPSKQATSWRSAATN